MRALLLEKAAQQGLVTEEIAEAAATKQATTAQLGLNAAFAANPVMAFITALTTLISVFSVLKGVYDHFHMSAEEAAEAIDNARQKQEEFAQSAKDTAEKRNSLEEARDEYNRLAKKAGAENYDSNLDLLTEEERTRYNELKELIASCDDTATAYYNNEGELILRNNIALDDTIEKLKEKQRLQASEYYNGEDYQKTNEAYQQQYDSKVNAYNNAKLQEEGINQHFQQALSNINFTPEQLIANLSS